MPESQAAPNPFAGRIDLPQNRFPLLVKTLQPTKKNPRLTDRELEAMKRRCEAAAPGPWRSFIEGRDHAAGSNFIMTGEGASRGADIELTGATDADQDFIANDRQDIPKLLAEVSV